jgi:tRNA1(Val) A37 N6-methylase TrmN6
MAENRSSLTENGFTEDAFLGGALRLRQPRQGHRAGHDAILLAAATPAREGQRIVDFGAGVGAAGLALARRVAGVHLIMVEINPNLADLARTNAASNAIDAQVRVLDVTADAQTFIQAGLGADTADGVMMNPPFNDPARTQASPDISRAVAHTANPTTLSSWVHAARRVLNPGGSLTLIWRADDIAVILETLGRGFGTIAIKPVHSKPDAPAIRLLIRAIKGGKAATALLPGLILTGADGSASPLSESLLAGPTAMQF